MNMGYLGIGAATEALMHVEGTFSVLAIWPLALSASAVCFLGRPVHGTFHQVATALTLHAQHHPLMRITKHVVSMMQ